MTAAAAKPVAKESKAKPPLVVAVVGCGFLGSLFTEELAKLYLAFEEPLSFVFIDDDTIDERNPANHLYTPAEIGVGKAACLQDRMEAGKYHIGNILAIPKRVGEKFFPEQLKEADIIIDCVDNLETRQWLWKLGRRGQPVLHLGVSQSGTGVVEWTAGEYDTFCMSLTAMLDYTPEQIAAMTKVVKLPPCDLVAFRGLGLMTALAAAKAVGIAYGLDPVGHGEGKRQLTSWNTTNMGHSLREAKDVD